MSNFYWDPNKHPRNSKGEFTNKDGSESITSASAAKILYANSNVEKQNKEKSDRYRDKLLSALGKNMTEADALYGTPEQLEDKIKSLGLEDKLKGMMTGAETNVKQNTKNNFIKPVEGIIKSDFGYRKQPTPGASEYHSGIDLKVPIGTPVKSIASGVVIKSGKASGYGNAVYVDHGIINGKRVISEYGHLSKFDVKVGDKITAGQIIAKSGNTGRSTGPHLHLTIRENGKAVDPKKYIKF